MKITELQVAEWQKYLLENDEKRNRHNSDKPAESGEIKDILDISVNKGANDPEKGVAASSGASLEEHLFRLKNREEELQDEMSGINAEISRLLRRRAWLLSQKGMKVE